MKIHARRTAALIVPVLALPLLPAFVPRGAAVAFGPEDGSSLTKELEIEMKLFLEDLTVTADGQELPAEMLMGEVDEGIVFNAVVGVTDQFVKCAAGKHLELLRTYDSLSLEGGLESQTEAMEEFGEYEDSTVRFKWDEEASEYEITFAEEEGDAEVLENLEVDMDFLALLPTSEVAVGDTWEASGTALGTVFLPGGMVPLDIEEDETELSATIQEALEAQLEQAFAEFRVRCEYGGERDEEGTSVGVISLKFEGKASIDLSDVIDEVVASLSEAQGVEITADVSASIDLEFSGEGTLLWNLEGRHVHNFDMSSELTLLGDVDASVEAEGESHTMDASVELSGDGKWSLSTSK